MNVEGTTFEISRILKKTARSSEHLLQIENFNVKTCFIAFNTLDKLNYYNTFEGTVAVPVFGTVRAVEENL